MGHFKRHITALFHSLPKDKEVNSRKISVRWGRFRFFIIIRVCDGHQFCCFSIIYVIIQYQIYSNHIYFILIHENLGLDTKTTCLLQLEQKLWHIYRNKVWNWWPSSIFSCFSSFYTHNNGLPCCTMVFIWFLAQENIRLDPKTMILHEVISVILEISDFETAILKNGRN